MCLHPLLTRWRACCLERLQAMAAVQQHDTMTRSLCCPDLFIQGWCDCRLLCVLLLSAQCPSAMTHPCVVWQGVHGTHVYRGCGWAYAARECEAAVGLLTIRPACSSMGTARWCMRQCLQAKQGQGLVEGRGGWSCFVVFAVAAACCCRLWQVQARRSDGLSLGSCPRGSTLVPAVASRCSHTQVAAVGAFWLSGGYPGGC